MGDHVWKARKGYVRSYSVCVRTLGKQQIESDYPTQAEVRLEWGTQHLLPVWQGPLKPYRVFFPPS
jgi:hypothetical protein